MAIDRRVALGLLAGGLAAPLLPRSLRAARAGPLWLSARARGDGDHSVSGFRRSGAPVFDLALPGRGHSFAVSPDGRAAVHFARRPGEFALAIDLPRGTVLDRFAPPENRRFQGHGAFDPDGRLLYASENDFAAARGAIGIYDAAEGYARLGELPSHGIGPHEIVLLPDGNTLAVANGGIATHPDMPRVKLNLPDMAPSLAYVDRRDGALLGEYRLDAALNRLGIRHLAVGWNGAVAVAMQYEGPRGDLVPLVALHRNGDLQFLDTPEAALRAMRQYCGSVAFDAGGRIAAASAPRGNIAAFWDTETGAFLSTAPLADGSGIAPAARPGAFVATSGRGGAFLIDARSGAAERIGNRFVAAGRWDNHLIAAGLGGGAGAYRRGAPFDTRLRRYSG